MAFAGSSQQLSEMMVRLNRQLEEALANGDKLPWQKPWIDEFINLHTGDGYSMLNSFFLRISSLDQGFKSPYWVGYKQAQLHPIDKKQYAGVPAGAKSTVIAAPRILRGKDKNGDEVRVIRGTRPTRVWNFEQLVNVRIPDANIPKPDDQAHKPAWNTIFSAWTDAPRVLVYGDRACYVPSLDEIHMPDEERFKSSLWWVGTIAHECAHATGHKKRLGRDLTGTFGTDKYAREELVAQTCATFLLAGCGVEDSVINEDENNMAYLLSWFRRTGGHTLLDVFDDAQRAFKYIMNGGKNADEESIPEVYLDEADA